VSTYGFGDGSDGINVTVFRSEPEKNESEEKDESQPFARRERAKRHLVSFFGALFVLVKRLRVVSLLCLFLGCDDVKPCRRTQGTR
jgi:hypothetical protein